jgi:hypothetical protein
MEQRGKLGRGEADDDSCSCLPGVILSPQQYGMSCTEDT